MSSIFQNTEVAINGNIESGSYSRRLRDESRDWWRFTAKPNQKYTYIGGVSMYLYQDRLIERKLTELNNHVLCLLRLIKSQFFINFIYKMARINLISNFNK